jgi:DNA-binding response OmpR family regulator
MSAQPDLHMGRRPTVLVILADPAAGGHLSDQLEADGFRPSLGRSIGHARGLAAERHPDVVILGDLEAPRDALDLLEEMRASDSPRSPWDPAVPALVLSARGHELDRLRAFDAGADDFMTHPASYLELRARLRSLLRRGGPGPPRRRLRVGALELDMAARCVALAGQPVVLSRLEFELLAHLITDPERVFTKEELLRAIWSQRPRGASRTLDTHASRLRRKLGTANGCWVANIWGVGYRLRA